MSTAGPLRDLYASSTRYRPINRLFAAELVLDQDALERNTAMGADEANKWSFPVVSRKLGCKENLSEVERACDGERFAQRRPRQAPRLRPIRERSL